MRINRRAFMALGAGALVGTTLDARASDTPADRADVCVYGGTASGVLAAVAAAREGCRAVLVEPSRWVGGMTGGGITTIDWGSKKAVGGTVLRVLKDGNSDAQNCASLQALIREHKIPVIYEHRLASVSREGASIKSITLDHAPPDRTGCPVAKPKTPGAETVSARVFIDCSYEGDLMAKAGVSYTYGRESSAEYGESLAGVRPNLAVYDIDPYVRPGDPASGLLPLLQDVKLGPPGSADKFTMAYCWRWKLTQAADRIPIEPPDDYDPRTYEVFRRGFQNCVDMSKGRRMHLLGEYLPAGGDVYGGNSSRALFAQSVAGSNAEYPDGDWPTRARLWKFHQEFVRGMTRFLQTDPAVPGNWKGKARNIGFKPGVFDETGGWPHQLYVREARRMKSAYVVTQKDVEGTTDPGDSVGLASYGVDDWPYDTLVHEGKVAINGGEFNELRLDEKHDGIYKIPYRSITPVANECANLLVPVCCSASHIAMTSIRMEPVWMILGESAGVAASLALNSRVPVQDIEYDQLRSKLLKIGQKLERPV